MPLISYDIIPGYFSTQQRIFYDDIIERAEENDIIVEVGCLMGKSMAYLHDRMLKHKKWLEIHCVDHFQGVPAIPYTLEINLWEVFKANMIMCGAWRHLRMTIHKMDSAKAAECLADKSCFCVFIDASHDYESVCKDIDAWLPKVKSGGVLAGDDYLLTFPGVMQAVAEKLPDARIEESVWIYGVT